MKRSSAALVFGMALLATGARGAYLIQVDTDGVANASVTLNPNFSFGGNTTGTSASSSNSTAFGMTTGSSIFGGNGTVVDTYVFTYSPDSQADNLTIPVGTNLGGGNLATGLAGGAPGTYMVYVTWPTTTNITGDPVTFDIATAGDSFSVSFNTNNTGNVWIPVGPINYTSGPITLTQTASNTTFVSMRSSGALFEAVPEPTTSLLLGASVLGLAFSRRRAAR